ncbi:MAG TPA: hypothetical protein VF057_02275 [Thermoanaerobaculia bacterium]
MRLVGFIGASLLTACASSLPDLAVEGGAGQDISVAVAHVENPSMIEDRDGTRRYVIGVEVSNNSDHPVTVTSVSIHPEAMTAYQLQRKTVKFNQWIDPGDEHIFDIPVEGRHVRPFKPDERPSVSFRVMVALSNEQTYFYTFEGPIY